jgi:hypothetical protein
MITRCEVDKLIGSCENNTERLVILALVDLRLAALEICNMSAFNIRGKWLLVKDIRNNEKKCLFLSSNIDKLLFSLPPMPKDPREVREVVLKVADRAGIKATPTDLRRFSDNKHCGGNN